MTGAICPCHFFINLFVEISANSRMLTRNPRFAIMTAYLLSEGKRMEKKLKYKGPMDGSYSAISWCWHEKKFKDAFQQLTTSTNCCGHDTLLILGLSYLHGWGTAKNPQKAKECFATLQPGQRTYFGLNGSYELMACTVLEVRDDRVLLQICNAEYLPDDCRKKARRDDSAWDRCAQRKWLNKEFLKERFAKFERDLILETEVVTPPNPLYDKTDAPKNTNDRVYLLSVQEYLAYHGLDLRKGEKVSWHFIKETKRSGDSCYLANYAEFQSALYFGRPVEKHTLDVRVGEYLRTPGWLMAKRCFVVGDYLFYTGLNRESVPFTDIKLYYRPVFWISLK